VRLGDGGGVRANAVACAIMWWRAQVEITRLSNQEYFGERALIKEEPRKATIRAVANTPRTALLKKIPIEFPFAFFSYATLHGVPCAVFPWCSKCQRSSYPIPSNRK
jgi:hypothetical protein